jgi:hypothetical protein
MLKTFKQYINEVEIVDSGIPKFKAKSNDEIQKTHTPVKSSKMGDYHVTLAHHKSTGAKSVFVHHNNQHVGSIEGYHGTHKGDTKPNVLHVNKTALDQKHQGKHVMSDVYKHLVKHHGMNLRSDHSLSRAGAKMWHNVHKDSEIDVTRAHRLTPKDRMKVKTDPNNYEKNHFHPLAGDYGTHFDARAKKPGAH